MRRRIYWLLPDLGSARRAMDDLLLARVDEGHIHFVGPEGADMRGLHPAAPRARTTTATSASPLSSPVSCARRRRAPAGESA